MFKRLLLVISIAFSFTVSTIHAQDDPCERTTLITAFAEAVASDHISSWAQNYAACPPAVQEVVQALADIYATFPVEEVPTQPPANADDTALAVPYEGDAPVFKVSNALGLELTLRSDYVSALVFYDEGHPVITAALGDLAKNSFFPEYFLMYDPQARLYTAFPIKLFRHTIQEGDLNSVTLADGQTWQGSLLVGISDFHSDQVADLRFDEATLVSLPTYMETKDYTHVPAPGEAVWELQLGEPVNQTFTILTPTFRSSDRRPHCIGACGGPLTTGTGFSILVGEQTFEVNMEDFLQLSLDEQNALHFIGVQNNEGDGVFSLPGHTWFMIARLVDSPNALIVPLERISWKDGIKPQITLTRHVD
jgi:hypothetical protein